MATCNHPEGWLKYETKEKVLKLEYIYIIYIYIYKEFNIYDIFFPSGVALVI